MKAIETGSELVKARAMVMCFPSKTRDYNDRISVEFLSPLAKLKWRILRVPVIFRMHTSRLEKKLPGMLGYYFSRFSYFDSLVRDSILNDKISSIVNIGSGMDTKAYYITESENVRYFEVDHPEVIKRKKDKIKSLFGELPKHITYVAIDLNAQDIKSELLKSGFNTSDKTLFIMEGVSVYLGSEENAAIFKLVSETAKGSKFVFSYVTNKLISGNVGGDKTLKALHALLVDKYDILVQGYDSEQIEGFISLYDLKTLEHMGKVELKERYTSLRSLKMDIAEMERFILAEVK